MRGRSSLGGGGPFSGLLEACWKVSNWKGERVVTLVASASSQNSKTDEPKNKGRGVWEFPQG